MSPGSAPQHDPVLRARIQVPDLPVGSVERVALLDGSTRLRLGTRGYSC